MKKSYTFWLSTVLSFCFLLSTAQSASQKSQTKIDQDLQLIYDQNGKPEASEGAFSINFDLFLISNDKVRIEAVASNTQALIDGLKNLQATDIDSYKKIVNAWIPIRNIPKLEQVEALRFAKPVYKPVPDVGSVDSEADSAMAVARARRKYCLDGSGVKIGVLSDTYDALGGASAGVSSGDLPGTTNPNGYTTPVTVVRDWTSGIDEGRAMSELIHDLAPASDLFFASALFGQATFASDIMDLATTHSCDVIVDDIRYFEEPFYMDGLIAQACDKVYDMGVPYFASAGNYAQSSYEAPYFENRGSSWHDFDPTAGVDTMQSFTVNAGSSINITLQWDDPWGSITSNGAATDLDLYIYNATGTTVFASSIDGNIGLDPTEFIGGSASGAGTVSFNIAIKRYAGPWPAVLKWVIRNASGLVINEFTTPTVNGQATGYGHSNAAGANAVGAAYWGFTPAYGTNPPVAEPFTSSGGVQIRFDTTGTPITPITRSKPEFTAADGISNTFFSGGNFFGTSAAAPNAAAVGALMLEANPFLTPAMVRSFLQSTCIDMSTNGFDYLTGFGLVQADSAIKVTIAATCSVDSIVVLNGPGFESGNMTSTVDLRVYYNAAACSDTLLVNGVKTAASALGYSDVTLSGLPVNGQAITVTAGFQDISTCTRTELALFNTPSLPARDSLRITEIMYDPPETGSDTYEYIEIYNPTASAINMDGFYFSEGVSYTFGNHTIPAMDYVLVCEDSTALFNALGVSGFEWTNALSNGGEDIVLKDNFGRTLDSVDYEDNGVWPSASGTGPSIVLCDLSVNQNNGANWSASTTATGFFSNSIEIFGSPGAADNACSPCANDTTTSTTFTCDTSQVRIFTVNLVNRGGCDSIHIDTVVYVGSNPTLFPSVPVCDGDSALIFGNYQNTAGLYSDTLQNKFGCDSVLLQPLVISPGFQTSLGGTTICQGDSTLIFGNYQSIAGIYYDTVQSVNGCDSVLTIQLGLNPTDTVYRNVTTSDSTMAGVFDTTYTNVDGCDSVEITTVLYVPIPCGPADSTSISQITCDINQAGTSFVTLIGSDGCDSVVTTTVVYDPGSTSTLGAVTICEGQSAMVFGVLRGMAGTYYDTLANANGCDSILEQQLIVNRVDTVNLSATTGDPGQVGVYDTTYSNLFGCDSLVRTTLIYLPPAAMDSLRITEIMYNPPENFTDSLEYVEILNTGAAAVDLDGFYLSDAVSFTFGSHLLAPGSYVVVAGDSMAMFGTFGVNAFEWSGTLSNGGEAVVLKDNLSRTLDSVEYDNNSGWPSDANGDGPSIVLCDLSLDQNDGSSWLPSESATGIISDGGELKGSPGAADRACLPCTNDTVYRKSFTCNASGAGVFTNTFTNQGGCDSLVIDTIVFDAGSSMTLSPLEICQGQREFFFGNYYDMAGTYYDTLQNVNGCDSVLVQELIVNPTDTTFITMLTNDSTMSGNVDTTYLGNQFGCDSLLVITKIFEDTCTIDSVYRIQFTCTTSQVGVFITTLTNTAGCDSVIIDSVFIDPGSFLQLSPMRICEGDSALIFAKWQSLSGTYFDTLSNVNGCDSVLAKDLVVDPVKQVTLPPMTICDGDSLWIFGQYQSMPGVYYDTLFTARGCDSILIKQLMVNPTYSVNLPSMQICSGDSALIFGVYQTMSGTYYDSAQSVNGCDSIVSKTLVMTRSINTYDTLTICDGDSALVFGSYETTAGNYDRTYTSAAGCDSIHTITINVLPVGRSSQDMRICAGDSILLGGVYQSIAGTYYDTLVATNGCDSILATRLFIKPNYSVMVSDSICQGDSILIGGSYQTMAGSYTDSLMATNGCDSVVVTLLFYKDSADCTADSVSVPLVCVSDSGWALSTVVTTATANSYPWPGVTSVPAEATFVLPVDVGQPYPWPHLFVVPGSEVITAESGVTYYLKRFELIDPVGIETRFRMFVDDDMQIFINGRWIALEDGMGQVNWRTANHDLIFHGDGTHTNGYLGGDPFDAVTAADLDTVFKAGMNSLVLAIRNRTSKPDIGGFSFRMDLDKGTAPGGVKSIQFNSTAHQLGMIAYPNPSEGLVNIALTNAKSSVATLEVYDFSGKLLKVVDFKKATTLDISDYSQGVYLLKVNCDGKAFTERIMKE